MTTAVTATGLVTLVLLTTGLIAAGVGATLTAAVGGSVTTAVATTLVDSTFDGVLFGLILIATGPLDPAVTEPSAIVLDVVPLPDSPPDKPALVLLTGVAELLPLPALVPVPAPPPPPPQAVRNIDSTTTIVDDDLQIF